MHNTNTVFEIASDKEFHETLKNFPLVIVDFYADWCPPCKAVAPKYAAMASDYPNVRFCKVNIDDVQEVAGEFDIKAIPAFVLSQNGSEVNRFTGSDASKLAQLLESV